MVINKWLPGEITGRGKEIMHGVLGVFFHMGNGKYCCKIRIFGGS
jgi:hypothetical protein